MLISFHIVKKAARCQANLDFKKKISSKRRQKKENVEDECDDCGNLEQQIFPPLAKRKDISVETSLKKQEMTLTSNI